MFEAEYEPIGDAVAREQKEAIARRIHREQAVSDILVKTDLDATQAFTIVELIEKGKIKNLSAPGIWPGPND